MSGDIAVAEGGIAAGCRFFAGYPITPATEVAERMAYRLPQLENGLYVQMEDELASMNAILGASWGGMKTMTSTSGPGFSLMMENLGLGLMLETPCVLVNVQRGGPSTGLPTLVGQQDMMQARWGSHGDYQIIALCPNSPQECFDLTIRAFNFSEQYRLPVLVMTDEVVGHMYERVVIPAPEEIEIINRPRVNPKVKEHLPFEPDPDSLVPSMAHAGEGFRIHVTGLTHDEKGYPCVNPETQNRMIPRLKEKISINADQIITIEEINTADADLVIVSYGISARISEWAMQIARQQGLKVGFFRLITAWPFPEERIKEIAVRVKALVVVEINLGQMVLEVERAAAGQCKTVLVPNPGGRVHDPEEILQAIEESLK